LNHLNYSLKDTNINPVLFLLYHFGSFYSFSFGLKFKWGVWLGRLVGEKIAPASKEKLKENRNLLLTIRGKASLILFVSNEANRESVA